MPKPKRKITLEELLPDVVQGAQNHIDELLVPSFERQNLLPLNDEQRNVLVNTMMHYACTVAGYVAVQTYSGTDTTQIAAATRDQWNAALDRVFGGSTGDMRGTSRKSKKTT